MGTFPSPWCAARLSCPPVASPSSIHCPSPTPPPPHVQDDPRWFIADPICTFLFAALVLWTTRAILVSPATQLVSRPLTPLPSALADPRQRLGSTRPAPGTAPNAQLALRMLLCALACAPDRQPLRLLRRRRSLLGCLCTARPLPSQPTASLPSARRARSATSPTCSWSACPAACASSPSTTTCHGQAPSGAGRRDSRAQPQGRGTQGDAASLTLVAFIPRLPPPAHHLCHGCYDSSMTATFCCPPLPPALVPDILPPFPPQPVQVAGVEEVHDLHVWSLTPGIPLLCAHVDLSPEADPTEVLHTMNSYCRWGCRPCRRPVHGRLLGRHMAGQDEERSMWLAALDGGPPVGWCATFYPVHLPSRRSIGISHSTIQLVVNGSACPCVA